MFTGLLNDECNILLSSATVTSYGGQSIALTTIYSSRPCRISQLSMNERAILQREGIESSHRVFVEADMTLSSKHVVVVDSVSYLVIGHDTLDGALNPHHAEILVKRQA